MNDAPNQPFTGDEDIQRLYAALSWEAGGRRRRPGLAYSLIVHGAAVLTLLLSAVTPPTQSTEPEPTLVTQLVFRPKTSSAPPHNASATTSLPAPSGAIPIDDSEGASAELTVELTAISLGFERDARNLLPALLKKKERCPGVVAERRPGLR